MLFLGLIDLSHIPVSGIFTLVLNLIAAIIISINDITFRAE
ncbi:MAG: hypothetical protein ACFFBH_02190 [Promethearchaeota archaeon]